MHGDHDYIGAPSFLDLTDHLQSVQAWNHQVNEQQVGIKVFDEINCGYPVLGVTEESERSIRAQKILQSLAHEIVIFSQYNCRHNCFLRCSH